MQNTNEPHPSPQVAMAVISSGLAANIAIGAIVQKIGMPIYLDTIGTFAMVILLGWRWGLVGAAISVVVGTVIIFPMYFYYSATAIGIVLTVDFCRRRNWFRSPLFSAASGIVVSLVAASLSAPVTAYAFGGVTATGNDAMTAFFVSAGNTLLNSVLLSGFSSEPIDKVISALVAYWALSGLPSVTTGRFRLRSVSDGD